MASNRRGESSSCPGGFGQCHPGRRTGARGLTLFAVEKGTEGLDIEGVRLAGSSIGARMDFDAVEGRCRALVGEMVEAARSCRA